jgi:hypothetical protein
MRKSRRESLLRSMMNPLVWNEPTTKIGEPPQSSTRRQQRECEEDME